MSLAQTKVRVFAFDRSTADPVTGDAANITAKWAKDYGTPTALTDTNPVEAEDGFYYFDLSSDERDVSIIGEIFPESSSSGVQVIGVPAFFMVAGDATAANQASILAAIQGAEVIQVASPNVEGNLVLTQGDTYDGIGNPKAQWNVTTDYTDGWVVTLTIRDKDDAVVYTTTGSVDSATVIVVDIDAPTGLPMTGCPGQWQGKFDVELTKATSVKTIANGVCYINEDQTR